MVIGPENRFIKIIHVEMFLPYTCEVIPKHYDYLPGRDSHSTISPLGKPGVRSMQSLVDIYAGIDYRLPLRRTWTHDTARCWE